jgi:hypothetical protein
MDASVIRESALMRGEGTPPTADKHPSVELRSERHLFELGDLAHGSGLRDFAQRIGGEEFAES